MKIKNTDIEFTTLETIGDGSCLIHSILQAFSKDYNNLKNDIEKISLVKDVRYHLSEILNIKSPEIKNKTIYQILSRGELETISKDIPETKVEYMKAYLNSKNFLNIQYVELISEIFDINIVFISDKDKGVYQTGDNELLFKKNRDIVFVYYIQEKHFETIRIKNKTLFNTKNNLSDKKLINKIIK